VDTGGDTAKRKIPTNEGGVSTNQERVSTNDERVSTNEKRVSTNGERVSTNEERITTNEGRVSTNEERVSTNEERVSTNEGRRSITQLEKAGVVRAVGTLLPLDDSGAVEVEYCAMGRMCRERRRTGGDGGRGSVGMWATQWWAAAEDATALALEVLNSYEGICEEMVQQQEVVDPEPEEQGEGESTMGKQSEKNDQDESRGQAEIEAMLTVEMQRRVDGADVELVNAPLVYQGAVEHTVSNGTRIDHVPSAANQRGPVGSNEAFSLDVDSQLSQSRPSSGNIPDTGSNGSDGSGSGANSGGVSLDDRRQISAPQPIRNRGYSRVIGVYARGSVARGEARVGVSDVDLVVVLWGSDSPESVEKLARDKRMLRARLASADHWMGRWGHLATKADLRVVTVPAPPHPAGAALAQAIAGNPLARQPPTAVAALGQCLGDENMFILAAECATLFGPDLPLILPKAARIPPLRCLATLNADVTEALSDGGERALRWALKRCLRAAFERQMRQDGSRQLSTARPIIDRAYYSRDLYHCAVMVSDARPELGEDLAAALVASVHGPRAVWGALWWASGAALCIRLRDAIQ
jgi:hypothetical protein